MLKRRGITFKHFFPCQLKNNPLLHSVMFSEITFKLNTVLKEENCQCLPSEEWNEPSHIKITILESLFKCLILP